MKSTSRFLAWSWWLFTWEWLFRGKSSNEIYGQALSKNSIRTAILALSVGIAALSVTLSVFTGFQRVLSERVLTHFGHLRVDVNWQNFKKIDEYFEKNKIPSLEAKEFFWASQAIATGPKAGRGLFIEVVRRNENPLPTKSPDVIAAKLSHSLAQYLGVSLGEGFKLLIPGLIKKALPMELVAYDDVGVYEWDSRRLVVDEPSLRLYISREHPDVFARRLGDAHSVRLFLKKDDFPYDEDLKLRKLEQDVSVSSQKFFTDPFIRVRNWFEQKKNLLSGVAFDKELLSIIMALLTMVAALNVATSLLVLYFERDRQMALIRALGMSPSQMRSWITLQGFFIGLVASLLGMFIGFILRCVIPRLPWLELPEEVYNIKRLPLDFSFGEQFVVFSFGIVSATLVAFILSLVLSRMSVVNVLGHRR